MSCGLDRANLSISPGAQRGHFAAPGNRGYRTVSLDVTVAEAIRRMRDELVGALVVSEDGTSILGIISDRGIVDTLADHGVDVLKDRVRSVMTEGVLTCSADDRVGAIMAAMVARRIRHIPVVDEEGRLCGMVSMSDVVEYQLHEIQAEADAMREYISGR